MLLYQVFSSDFLDLKGNLSSWYYSRKRGIYALFFPTSSNLTLPAQAIIAALH